MQCLFKIFLASACLCLSITAFAQTRNPTPAKPEPIKLQEIGRVSKREFVRSVERFLDEVRKSQMSAVIINYGSDREIARREGWLKNMHYRITHDLRITIVRGGVGRGIRTVMWLQPPGAEYPKP